ncbi:hypothetical protein Ga0466249_004316 [Sporomusaceae bacterium BoRhaA]|uniref:hypothetical protein n=1 Tax=Pelorhabdus rhamnosifermentans TaxID=2772457 RepID=UPI001C061654|nr:hypothetical protein [Pelorhabdus rhamnosifermentans]MBU2703180.1 hypothetical protein [Pelorhabdus rhamnosifermentans]
MAKKSDPEYDEYGCRKVQQADAGEEDSKKPSQSDILLGIVNECQLFHDELKEPYVKFKVHNHVEVWPVRSTLFKRWLVGQFYYLTGRGCNSDAINQALNVAEAKSLFDGIMIKLSLRCAECEGIFWYDLANDLWEAVKISPDGWEIMKSPILFRRFANTAEQVKPSRNGDIHLLRKFVNLKNDNEFNLLAVYLVSCLIPDVPKIIVPLSGEKGASKSTMLRILRRLIDPAAKELLTMPHDQKELPLTLYKNYMPAFDNLSNLNEWQSDVLCCAATGGGISKRKLYTDDDEVILSFLRCVTLNGINTVATKPDLLDRSIPFELERIDGDHRQTERQFWKAFEEVRPLILGGMFDILVRAMTIYPTVKLDKLPRMADFCQWGYAIAESMGEWSGDEFLMAYYRNIGRANDEAIRNSPVANAVIIFMNSRAVWNGSAADLLKELGNVAFRERIDTNSKTWPRSAVALAKRLKHYKSNFADAGIMYKSEYNSKSNSNHIYFQKVVNYTQNTQCAQKTQENQGVISLGTSLGIETNNCIPSRIPSVPSDVPSGTKPDSIRAYGNTGNTGNNSPTFGETKYYEGTIE